MSVVFSGNLSGRFTSDGTAQFINLPTDVDWMIVKNETVSYAAGANTGAEFFWQRGMTNGRGTIYVKTAATNALQVGQIAANAGFFLTDTSVNTPGPSLALTGIIGNAGANATPQVQTANTASLVVGDIVRIYNTVGALQLRAIDFTVTAIAAGASFDLGYMATIVDANPGAGTFRKIPYDPIFYPRRRYISAITQAAQAVVTLTVTHGFTVGQVVRFVIPEVTAAAFGMTELNDVRATIVATGAADAQGITNTVTVDVDTSGFTAFAWPLSADGVFTPAQLVPVGEDTAEALSAGVNVLGDSTINTAERGMTLAAGTLSPAGVNGNVITWIAGKSFNQ